MQGVLPKHVRCIFVTQAEALGLGHAVLCAKPVVGDESFGVILPDDLIWNRGKGALRQMAEFAVVEKASAIAVEKCRTNRQTSTASSMRRRSAIAPHCSICVVEKPKPAVAPSNPPSSAAIVLAGPHLRLARIRPSRAPAANPAHRCESRRCWRSNALAYRFEGTRFDCGSKLGLVKATLHFAMQDLTLKDAVREVSERRAES